MATTTIPTNGYPSLKAMRRSSFQHVRQAAEALAAENMNVARAIVRLVSEGRDNAAWYLHNFGGPQSA